VARAKVILVVADGSRYINAVRMAGRRPGNAVTAMIASAAN